jgi:hypothetical protein
MAGSAAFLLGVTCPLGFAAGNQLHSLAADARLTTVVHALHVLVEILMSQ